MSNRDASGKINWATLACGLLACIPAAGAENEPAIAADEKWTNVFADTEVALGFVVTSAAGFKGRVAWAHASTEGRVFSRGEVPVTVEPGKSTTALARVQLPPVKTGVILKSVVSGVLVTEAGRATAANMQRTLWLFPTDPFADRTEWVKSLKIFVYDPGRTTAAVLEKANVPFDEIQNPARIGELRDGLIVVGEGVSLRRERGLAELLLKVAAGGATVLCLSPADGSFPIPGADEDEGKLPGSLSLRRQDVITELDKRLDRDAWLGRRAIVATRLELQPEGTRVVAAVLPRPAEGGWPWLVLEFPQTKGKLTICGFGLMESWEAGPTLRYLFARLLETMDKKQQSKD